MLGMSAVVLRAVHLLIGVLSSMACIAIDWVISLYGLQGNLFDNRAIVVQLQKATNADVLPAAQTTIVSQAPSTDFETSFSPGINKVLLSRKAACQLSSAMVGSFDFELHFKQSYSFPAMDSFPNQEEFVQVMFD